MAQLTIQQAFDLALQHHQAGRLHEAEQLYRQVLAQQPNHAKALHLLGVLAGQVGRNDVAVDLIRRAIAFRPNWRWLLDGQDSPWYPTMRLFRQPRIGDWESVIARVAVALSLWSKNRPRLSGISFSSAQRPCRGD